MSVKSSISEFFKIDELKDNFVKLLEAKFELKKLEILEKLEGMLSGIIVKLALAIFLVMVFIFLNILLAVGLNYLTATTWAGYAIMAGVYLVIWVILNSKKKTLEEAVKLKIREAIEESGV